MCTALFGAVPSAGATGPDDWPTFHHDAAHSGVSPDTKIGATSLASGMAKWSVKGGGGSKGNAAIEASPVVVYNAALAKTLVYITSTGTPGAIEAIDDKTGAVVWSDSVGPSASTPAVYGNTVYFGDQDHALHAVNATTGGPLCTYPTTGDIQSSPVVGVVDNTGPVVFFGDQGTSESTNGGHEWAINGVGNGNGACTLKWVFNSWLNRSVNGSKAGSWSSPALGQDSGGRWLLVLGSSNPDNAVYALDATLGSQVWRFQTVQTGGDQDVGAAPTISAPGANGLTDGAVYINGKDKVEYALDLLNGSQIWSFGMSADAGINFNSVSATCLVGADVVVSYSNYTYELNAATGAKIWRTPATTGPMLASPSISGAVGDQVVFVGDLSGIEYAYKLSDGSLITSHVFGGTNTKIFSTAAISDGKVFIATSAQGKVYAFT